MSSVINARTDPHPRSHRDHTQPPARVRRQPAHVRVRVRRRGRAGARRAPHPARHPSRDRLRCAGRRAGWAGPSGSSHRTTPSRCSPRSPTVRTAPSRSPTSCAGRMPGRSASPAAPDARPAPDARDLLTSRTDAAPRDDPGAPSRTRRRRRAARSWCMAVARPPDHALADCGPRGRGGRARSAGGGLARRPPRPARRGHPRGHGVEHPLRAGAPQDPADPRRATSAGPPARAAPARLEPRRRRRPGGLVARDRCRCHVCRHRRHLARRAALAPAAGRAARTLPHHHPLLRRRRRVHAGRRHLRGAARPAARGPVARAACSSPTR